MTTGKNDEPLLVRLRELLGANTQVARQRFGIYLPNRDCHGAEVLDMDFWIGTAMTLLSKMNGGATAFPPASGMWMKASGDPLAEETTFVYSFIKPERFLLNIPLLRAYLHKFGRDTNQGEVLVEFADLALSITNFDMPAEP